MIRTLGILALVFACSCGDMKSSSITGMNGAISGKFGNTPAKEVTTKLLKKWQEGSLKGYTTKNNIATSKDVFSFSFKDLKTPKDLKDLLEKELKAKVTLDEKAKTFTVD